MKQTLAEFGVPVELVSSKEGPTVTQFGLEPGEVVKELRSGERQRRRVSVHSILRLSNDLALALAAPSIRIEAPVPGRPYVGVEIPNAAKTLVGLRGILESKEYAKASSSLALALGRDVSGDPVVVDLDKMPHLLIAGATGSGKSVCINALVDFVSGATVPLTVIASTSLTRKPFPGAQITVRVISTAGPPQILFRGVTGNDGMVKTSCAIPDVGGANAALIIVGFSPIGSSEAKYMIRKKA